MKKDQKTKNVEKHKIIKKIIGLALLPMADIPEGFRIIQAECRRRFRNDKKMKNFLLYVRNSTKIRTLTGVNSEKTFFGEHTYQKWFFDFV